MKDGTCIWHSFELDLVNVIEYAISSKNLHTFLEIGPVSNFQNLTSAKPRPKTHGIWKSLRLGLVNINVCANFLSKYFLWFKNYGQFSHFYSLDIGKASTNDHDILQSLGLDLVNINRQAKLHQTIP